MTARTLATLALTAALLAGCSDDESSAATLRGPLEYTRDGGFAGISEGVVIQRDGRALVQGGEKGNRRVKLTAAELDRVARLVQAADIGRIKVRKGGGIDAFYYAISYRGTTLEFDDSNAPRRAARLVGALNRIIKKYGGGLG